MPIALYIHIPFCARKCAYCDFASYAGALGQLPGYLHALDSEMAGYPPYELASVYIGGGTPSLMNGAQMRALMDAVRARFVLLPAAEISMEANPGTLDRVKLDAYLASGVNRLSIGAQAMQPHLLETIGRIHSWAQLVDSFRMAREAGFQNIDLMYALPGQTARDWADTLDATIRLSPEHVSAYSLILEPDTPLHARADLSYPDEDQVIQMQREATKRLGAAGLSRYEISNYAKAGFECRHNIVYWTRGDYIGLGAAAHSLLLGERFENSRELCYHQQNRQPIAEQDAFEEMLMLGTRMARGIPAKGLNPARIAELAAHGLIKTDQGLVYCTERGFELHNAVVLHLLG